MRRGDTLESIAKKRELDVLELQKLNHDVSPGGTRHGALTLRCAPYQVRNSPHMCTTSPLFAVAEIVPQKEYAQL